MLVHQSSAVGTSQEELDAASDAASAVKKERDTNAYAQLTFSSLYSPGFQSREWCHTQWAGLQPQKFIKIIPHGMPRGSFPR